jgi:integrase
MHGGRMTGCHIRVRVLKDGSKRYVVRYRRGGRGFRVEHAGSFATKRDAETRRDLVRGWLAAGLDPRTQLVAVANTTRESTFRQAGRAYVAARIDVDDGTIKNIESALARTQTLDALPLSAITVQHLQDWIVEQQAALVPSTLNRYFSTIRGVLDNADVDPNPARNKRLRFPRTRHEEIAPPPADHVLVILETVTPRWRLPIVTIEQTGMAIGETSALTWGDVDTAASRFRLRRATVKGQIKARARWVQVPDWLMGAIDASCPVDDRTPDRKVFQGVNLNSLRATMNRACRVAGIPVYSPHDLRHRRISLWHGQGIPARELAARAGHTNASMSLDTYSHVMPLDEVPRADFEKVLR